MLAARPDISRLTRWAAGRSNNACTRTTRPLITGGNRPVAADQAARNGLRYQANQNWRSLPGRASRLARVSLSIGIVGLPNVGKSTLFNALTRASALASNYPFATIEPNVGIVGIPDPRLAALAGLYDSARIVPATVRFLDIAGLVRGASQGQGLGNQFLCPHPRDRRDLPGRARLHRPGRESRGRRCRTRARYRDDRDRADPGRPADAGEGRAPAGQGNEIRQESRTGPRRRCRGPGGAGAGRRDADVRRRRGGRDRPG